MSKLKSCPFCGADAYVRTDNAESFVACLGADCYVAVGEGYNAYGDPSHIFPSEKAAAAAWNRRTPPDARGATITDNVRIRCDEQPPPASGKQP